ncbi:putative sigma factor binding protein [Helianthus annuus]|uniref:Sigma factor binding protein 1/2 n=1 Tax=Helianthus annuus TaxID=4232 RepID=A0A9K3H8Y2_HELAN|nr:putative sigma factor binding protein 1/2 [Helianthus annuus]KAJ0470182.1 putative sigma factor binding protein [Helianthus annuus]KAJ0841668.1 putative sigma factor binding protein [Helianthus annuus]KAJ0855199.1 putative sigma factor binding protein [Helianthus annuus]
MNKNNGGRAAGKNPTPEASDKSVKVKYISSPVLVEAKNPSQFKEIVQHFTGHNANETAYSMYSNPTTMAAATTTIGSANTNTTQGADQYFAYGTTHMNPQAGIDGYSWEEIAEWNRNR